MDGKVQGLLTEWYENGSKKSETTYVDDKPHGPSRRWDEDGSKLGELTWFTASCSEPLRSSAARQSNSPAAAFSVQRFASRMYRRSIVTERCPVWRLMTRSERPP